MSLDGWTVHWLTPMTSTSQRGVTIDYGAKPVSEHWPDLAALRAYIADEPARRARRRTPADAANPGEERMFAYEAFSVDKHGVRTRVGESVRDYRPGVDVLVEQTATDAWKKMLPLDFGLSVSAIVYPKEELTGFGLVLAKDDSGFSWEWFNRERDDVFRKLLGGGSVRVSMDAGSSSRIFECSICRWMRRGPHRIRTVSFTKSKDRSRRQVERACVSARF
ncbi:MAG TPA: hypothetical protein VGQ16_09735, partial [Vicinamibacterales bacterium]|nr:hypothetical protein [Vicinamibacterales bacterium]